MNQQPPKYWLSDPDGEMPTMRLCTRNFATAQQWCNELADTVSGAIELLVVGQGASGRVRCGPAAQMCNFATLDAAVLELQHAVDTVCAELENSEP